MYSGKSIFVSEILPILMKQVRNRKDGYEGLNYFKDLILLTEKAFEIVRTEKSTEEWTDEDSKKFAEIKKSIEGWLNNADDSEIIKNLEATDGIERGQFKTFLIRIGPLEMQNILVRLAQYQPIKIEENKK